MITVVGFCWCSGIHYFLNSAGNQKTVLCSCNIFCLSFHLKGINPVEIQLKKCNMLAAEVDYWILKCHFYLLMTPYMNSTKGFWHSNWVNIIAVGEGLKTSRLIFRKVNEISVTVLLDRCGSEGGLSKLCCQETEFHSSFASGAPSPQSTLRFCHPITRAHHASPSPPTA